MLRDVPTLILLTVFRVTETGQIWFHFWICLPLQCECKLV